MTAPLISWRDFQRSLEFTDDEMRALIDEARMSDALRDALLNYERQSFCWVEPFVGYFAPGLEPGWDARAEALAVRGRAYE